MRTKLILFLLVGLLIPVTASAHPGGTDSNGGHFDHSTGEYHYHHGYEAHQHPDGVCPYDFDDQTGQNSGTSSGSSSSSGSSFESDWIRYEYSPLFGEFSYNQSTDEWVRDDGEYYESSSELFDCYGFTYDSGCDVWFNEDGFLDEDLCLQDFPDGDLFLCPECGNLMDIYDEDGHDDWCEYPTQSSLQDEEGDKHIPAYSNSTEKEHENEPSPDGPIKTGLKWIFGCFGLLIAVLMIGGTAILTLLYGVAFFGTVISKIISAFNFFTSILLRKRKELQVYKSKRTELTNKFNGKSIRNIVGMPPDVLIGPDGLPSHNGPGQWGVNYTVYTSRNGQRYHRICGCSYARNPENFVHIANTTLSPCKLCVPVVLDTRWYYKYLYLLELEKEYNLSLIHDEYNSVTPSTPALP